MKKVGFWWVWSLLFQWLHKNPRMVPFFLAKHVGPGYFQNQVAGQTKIEGDSPGDLVSVLPAGPITILSIIIMLVRVWKIHALWWRCHLIIPRADGAGISPAQIRNLHFSKRNLQHFMNVFVTFPLCINFRMCMCSPACLGISTCSELGGDPLYVAVSKVGNRLQTPRMLLWSLRYT